MDSPVSAIRLFCASARCSSPADFYGTWGTCEGLGMCPSHKEMLLSAFPHKEIFPVGPTFEIPEGANALFQTKRIMPQVPSEPHGAWYTIRVVVGWTRFSCFSFGADPEEEE